MEDAPRVRRGLLLWPLRCFVLGHQSRHPSLMLALLFCVVPWLLALRLSAASVYPVRSLLLPAGSPPVGAAIDPVLGRAFVADAGNDVWALDERSGQLLGAADVVTAGAAPLSGGMAVDAARHRVYVADLAGHLTALDGRTGEAAPPWTVQPTFGLAFDNIADRLLVPQPGQATLVALDAETGQVVATVPLAERAATVAVDPPARRVYVAAINAARLDLLDADTYRLLATVALPGPAAALTVDATTERVYAAVAGGIVAVIDGRTGAALATAHVGPAPVALALNPATGHLLVAEADADQVVVVDPRRDALLVAVPVAGRPAAIAVDPRTGLVVVASSATVGRATLLSSRTVTVLRDQRSLLTLWAALRAELPVRRAQGRVK